jgi:hypothetical protein
LPELIIPFWTSSFSQPDRARMILGSVAIHKEIFELEILALLPKATKQLYVDILTFLYSSMYKCSSNICFFGPSNKGNF